MASNGSDSRPADDSIPAQRDEIARQLVEAVTQCRDAPAVARQQAEVKDEIRFIEAILNPLTKFVGLFRNSNEITNIAGDYVLSLSFDQPFFYRRYEHELEQSLDLGAVFARETGNRALTKAIRQLREALGVADRAIEAALKDSDQDSQIEGVRHALEDLKPLLLKAEDRLGQLRIKARVRLDGLNPRAAEMGTWDEQRIRLQEVAYAMAAGRCGVQEDEGGNDR